MAIDNFNDTEKVAKERLRRYEGAVTCKKRRQASDPVLGIVAMVQWLKKRTLIEIMSTLRGGIMKYVRRLPSLMVIQ